ncbi:hypothetical protein F5878DRAFT_604425 [Lentinula raphanica]|uniref:Uncharacterized protein n=1 Tax=Lentinula raphanica TaxID=153919 RepID=A0AA38PIV5_9AGAR|nr:hypothetical protein F5878DRAFT_604425 [Lentinula raphanica]
MYISCFRTTMKRTSQPNIATHQACTPFFAHTVVLLLCGIAPTVVAQSGGTHARSDGGSGSTSSSRSLGVSSSLHRRPTNTQCVDADTGEYVTCPPKPITIAGIVIVSLVVAALLGYILWRTYRYYKNRREQKRSILPTASSYQPLDGHVHPEGSAAQDAGKNTYPPSISDSTTVVGHDDNVYMPEPLKSSYLKA